MCTSSYLQRLKQLGDRGRSLLCARSNAEHRNGLRYCQLSCFACILQMAIGTTLSTRYAARSVQQLCMQGNGILSACLQARH